VRIVYGPDDSQFGELYLPAGGDKPTPVVVVIHGGYWHAQYGLDLGAPLAADLAAHGVAAWNIEYRRIENGGRWPATFDDVATATDALVGPVQDAAHGRLDLAQVRAVGHSAGGHLAVWLAGRHTLTAGAPGSGPRVRVQRVVSQAGVLDLLAAERDGLGDGSAAELMGTSSNKDKQRYLLASPQQQLPIGVPVTCVHGDADTTVPPSQSADYVSAAQAVGDHATLIRVAGADHFALIDPTTRAWADCRDALLAP